MIDNLASNRPDKKRQISNPSLKDRKIQSIPIGAPWNIFKYLRNRMNNHWNSQERRVISTQMALGDLCHEIGKKCGKVLFLASFSSLWKKC
jgi:hypothetical protein